MEFFFASIYTIRPIFEWCVILIVTYIFDKVASPRAAVTASDLLGRVPISVVHSDSGIAEKVTSDWKEIVGEQEFCLVLQWIFNQIQALNHSNVVLAEGLVSSAGFFPGFSVRLGLNLDHSH